MVLPLGVLGSARVESMAWVTGDLEVFLTGTTGVTSTTWADISGNSRHATLVGPNVTSGSGLVTLGVSSYASIPYQLPAAHTVEVAGRFTSAPAGAWDIMFGADGWWAAAGVLALRVSAGALLYRRAEANALVDTSIDPAAVHVWAFSAAAGGTMRVHCDGAPVAPTSGTPTTGPTTCYLGARHGNDGTGVTDAAAVLECGEARIYSRALTDGEIAANFDASRGRYGL